MPKYMTTVSYTAAGAQGLAKDGASRRREVINDAVLSLGGTVEAFYFAYGEDDAYLIMDMPDETAALALAIPVAAAGGARVKTIPIFTCEQVDAALKQEVTYRPPGA